MRKLAKMRRLDISASPSLPGVLALLISSVIPGISDERLAEILALRSVVPANPIYDVATHEDLLEVSLKDDHRDLEVALLVCVNPVIVYPSFP